MSAAALIENKDEKSSNGIRPISLRTDLGGIAELIELCFAPVMNESGRAAIREMRMLSQRSGLAFLISSLDRMMGGVEEGFVWLENGRIVGNVSLGPANYPRSLGKGFVIANVAVHPDFRRHGIARALMAESLKYVRQKGGNFAILQVDVVNEGAQKLYKQIGFHEECTFNFWQRPSHMRPPVKLSDPPFMTLRQGNEWQNEYQLAELVRPNQRGGLGWLRPTHPRFFQPSLLHSVSSILGGKSEEHWIIRSNLNQNGRTIIAASLRATSTFGGADQLELLVHPAFYGQLEDPLINYALRRLNSYRPIVMEHPADDFGVTDIMQRYGFNTRHSTIHMRYDV